MLPVLLLQDGWKAWKRALKQSNALDDDGEQDAASLAAAKMVAAANRRFEAKGKGAADIPFSMLHKVGNGAVVVWWWDRCRPAGDSQGAGWCCHCLEQLTHRLAICAEAWGFQMWASEHCPRSMMGLERPPAQCIAGCRQQVMECCCTCTAVSWCLRCWTHTIVLCCVLRSAAVDCAVL